MDPIAAEHRRQLVARPERLGVGKPALRMAPRSVEQTLQQQQGHRVEQQRRDHLVDTGDPLEPGGQQRPQQTGGGTGRQSERQGEPGVQLGRVQAGDGGADRPGEELPLGADVVVAGAEGDGHGESGQQERRGGQEHLLDAVSRRQRCDQVPPVGGGRAGTAGADRDGRDQERGDDGEGDGDRRPPPRRPGPQYEVHESTVVAGHQQAEGSRRGVGPRQLADDPSGEQHDDAIGEGEQLVEVLGDQQHTATGLAQPAQLVVDVGVGTDVEAAGRLGGDEGPGRAGQRPGQEDLLQVAAGQPAGGVVGLGADVEVGDQPPGVLAHPVALGEPVAPEAVEVLEDEVLLDGQPRHDAAAAILGDPPEPGADPTDRIGRR